MILHAPGVVVVSRGHLLIDLSKNYSVYSMICIDEYIRF